MKTKILTLVLGLFVWAHAAAQLDENSKKELQNLKNQAQANNTVLWMYDTVYRAGQPYCLLTPRLLSNDGNEYVIKNLAGEELVYIMQPGDVEKVVGKLTGDANTEFSFFKETQKLNVPLKSIDRLPNFIVERNLIAGDHVNMAEVKKMLFIYSERNPQGYTSNIPADTIQVVENQSPARSATDTGYQLVVRNRNAAVTVKDYTIMQDGKLIGRYNKSSASDGSGDNKTVYTIKLPNWKDIATATNGGLVSASWEIIIHPSGKRESFKTGSLLPKNTLKELVEFLISKNYL